MIGEFCLKKMEISNIVDDQIDGMKKLLGDLSGIIHSMCVKFCPEDRFFSSKELQNTINAILDDLGGFTAFYVTNEEAKELLEGSSTLNSYALYNLLREYLIAAIQAYSISCMTVKFLREYAIFQLHSPSDRL